MRLGKRTREAAAVECAINASNRGGVFAKFDHREVRASIDTTPRSGGLANAAFHHSLPLGSIAFREAWANAESLIRTGCDPMTPPNSPTEDTAKERTVLDRLEAICASVSDGTYYWTARNGETLAAELRPLLPLLREWEVADREADEASNRYAQSDERDKESLSTVVSRDRDVRRLCWRILAMLRASTPRDAKEGV